MSRGAARLTVKGDLPRRRFEKQILDRSTKFEELRTDRARVELHIRSLTGQLRNAERWLPQLALMRPDMNAAELLGRIRWHRSDLIKHASELARLEREQFGPEPDRFRFEPGREDIIKMKQAMDVLESVRGPYDYRVVEGIGEGGATEPTAWTAVLWSFRATEYPSIWWSEDDDATFTKAWNFDPYYAVDRGILTGRFTVTNPAPFDWPFVEEDHDWSQLMVAIALEFDVPAQDFDAQVFYEANMALGLSPFYDARDHFHFVSAIACEQPDASTGAPASLSDFEHVGEPIQNSPGHFEQTRQIDVARNYSVRAGVSSRIHLGMTWNLSLASGVGGTMNDAWDNLVIFRPDNEDIWGVKVTAVPV